MNGTIGSLVILGATGTIGRGVVAAAVAAGRPVVAIARDVGALITLQKSYPSAALTYVPGSVGSEAEAASLAAQIAVSGHPIGGVVAAVCGVQTRGRLIDAPADALRHALDDELMPHLFAARHLLPLLAANSHSGGYVLVGGPAADTPWAGYGRHSVSASALRMLARVLHDEARALHVRVQMLSVDAPVRTEANALHACPQWPDVLAVGRSALALVESSRPGASAVVHHARHAILHKAAPRRAPVHISVPQPDARSVADVRALLDSISQSRLDLYSP